MSAYHLRHGREVALEKPLVPEPWWSWLRAELMPLFYSLTGLEACDDRGIDHGVCSNHVQWRGGYCSFGEDG